MEARVAYTVNEAVLYIHSGELDPGPGEQATSLGLFFSKKTPISPAFSFLDCIWLRSLPRTASYFGKTQVISVPLPGSLFSSIVP